jgi:glycine cleavage system aminomethyltransferase T
MSSPSRARETSRSSIRLVLEIRDRRANAFKALQYLAANNLDKAPGSATYTELCNERGGI